MNIPRHEIEAAYARVREAERLTPKLVSTNYGATMNKLEKATLALARASNGNPVLSTLTVMLFFVMFNVLEATIEKLMFGERFEHWLDPFFMLAFIAYSAYSVWWCSIFNSIKERDEQ